MQRHPALFIANTNENGRGVFSAADIETGAFLEICPVIVIPAKEKEIIHKTVLHDYYFNWGEGDLQCAIALGFGSIYNHSDQANVEFEMDFDARQIVFTAIKPIKGNDELFINYFKADQKSTARWF